MTIPYKSRISLTGKIGKIFITEMELGCSLVGNRLVVSDPVSYWEYVISTNLPVICQFSLYFVINFPLILLVQGCLKEIQQMCDLNWVSRWTELCLHSKHDMMQRKILLHGGYRCMHLLQNLKILDSLRHKF